MPEIRSKAISFADYDSSSGELYLTFTSGRTYTFFEVPRAVYDQFLVSTSKGKFYNLFIKDKFQEK